KTKETDNWLSGEFTACLNRTKLVLNSILFYPCSSVCICGSISLVGDAACNDCRHGSAAEFTPVERRIARLARGFCRAEGPFVVGGKNCQVARLIFRDAALHP